MPPEPIGEVAPANLRKIARAWCRGIRAIREKDAHTEFASSIYEAQALVAWTAGTQETAATLLHEAHRLVTFALGADTVEARHLTAQINAVASGDRPHI